MERIDALLDSGTASRYGDRWLPALPEPLYTLPALLKDVWLVWTRQATAVQWPHQRRER